MSANLDSGTWPGASTPWSTFAALYREHYAFVWRCAARMGVREAELEDVVQETFVIALRRLDEFDLEAEGKASSWLFAILRNVIRNHARGERRRAARVAGYGQQPIDLEQRARAGQAGQILGRRLLGEFLEQLDDKRRAVFVLAELEGLTGREIADALAINVNTAHARLRAARQAFRDHFGEVDELELARAHAEPVPEAARQRSWALLVGLAPTPGLVASSSTLGSLGLTKLVAGFAALGLVALGGVALQARAARDPEDSSATIESRSSSGTRSSEVERSTLASANPSPAIIAEPEPDPTIVVRASPEPIRLSAPRPDTAPEHDSALGSTAALQRLAAARKAMLADDPERALALVRETPWPVDLAEQRTALEIGALCRLGRSLPARELADRWRVDHPGIELAFTKCWLDPRI